MDIKATENIIMLLKHSIENQNKKNILISHLKELNQTVDMHNIDEIDEIEKEIEFLEQYCNTLQSQAVVIMNENNIDNIPLLLNSSHIY